jgi:hypothetical protein
MVVDIFGCAAYKTAYALYSFLQILSCPLHFLRTLHSIQQRDFTNNSLLTTLLFLSLTALAPRLHRDENNLGDDNRAHLLHTLNRIVRTLLLFLHEVTNPRR